MYRLIPQVIRVFLDFPKPCFPELRRLSWVSCEDDIAYVPPEIWDLILRELDDHSLFTAGGICRAFNSRSTVIYLERKAISSEALAAGALDIESHCLPALLLPTFKPQLKTLVCRFTTLDDVPEDLHRLRRFLDNSHSLEELQLFFPYDDDLTRNSISEEAQYLREITIAAMNHISRAMAGKTAGPVFILPTPKVYMIGNWGAFGRGGSPGSFSFIAEAEDEEKKVRVIGSANLVWGPLWSRRSAPAHSAANPTSVLFRRISAASGAPRPFTLIAFGMDEMWWFQLGRSNSREFPPWEASPSTISTVLPHLTFPVLQHLHIHERLDPTALGAFLRRHLHITSISDETSGESMLLDAPVTLPLLTNISCADIARLGSLLDALDSSPQLAHISIPFQLDTPAAAASLTHALRRLSTVTFVAPICLLLDMVESEAEPLSWPPMDDVLGRLHGVNWVHVRCDTIGGARGLVPWLEMLPALLRVEFEFSKRAGRRATRALVQETRAMLTGVHVSVLSN
ncbi:hypothetical protein MSAN_00278800 [Mycena sanguinolenta]|uniref:F-box domain-containing protein n=1 Tax=Mycena sanguinolenta TaxID=230812 RepID=A0A8H6ZIP0_9AGAR|nr:hypothetical protein MSAN_00278800 [Mycena sanguinolenta]